MVSKSVEMLQKHKAELAKSSDILQQKIAALKKDLGMNDAGKLEAAAQDAVIEKATARAKKMRDRVELYINKSSAKTIEEYCENLKVAVRALLAELRNSIDTGSDCEDGTLLGWYCRLPSIIKECEAAKGIYSSRDATRMCLLKAERIFGLLLKDPNDPDRWHWVRRYLGLAPPGDASLDAIDAYNQATSLTPQNKWVQAFWSRKLSEKYAIDLHLCEFIYTVDCKECTCDSLEECELKQKEEDRIEAEKGDKYVKENKIKHRKKPPTPSNTDAHGWNAAPWAVVNWALRVANDPNTKPETVAICEETLACYTPFIERLEEALYLLPQDRRVVFRGVGVPGISKNYKKGTSIVLAPFSSTSLVGAQALGFMKGGGCFFIFIVSEAGSIEPASWYPEQAESLLNTFAQFVVKRKLSRTLLRMIGVQYDVVSAIQNIPGAPQPSDEQVVDAVIREATHVTFLFEKYLASYVQAQVTTKATSDDFTGIYTMMDQFVRSSVKRMLLVGSAGSGKTSATLAATSHLNKKHGTAVYPLFISLPSVPNVCSEADALDKHILELLDLTPEQFKVLTRTRTVVLLLDSFDECRSIRGEAFQSAWLINNNPLAAVCKIILSVRDEAFPTYSLTPETSAILEKEETIIRYVAGFTDADVRSFIMVQATKTKNVAESKAIMTKICELRFSGAKELRYHPITLSMLVKLALANKLDDTVMTKGDVYMKFIQLAIKDDDLNGLKKIATEMLKTNSWQVTVGEVRAQLPESDLTALPVRVEDQSDAASFFSFWHRSIGEFIAAMAINADVKASMDSLADNSFSKRCPSIALFFGSLATVDSITKMEALVNDSSSSASNRSNALSLLASLKGCTMNVKLTDITIDDCNLNGCDFGRSSLENVTFNSCWIEGIRMLDCAAWTDNTFQNNCVGQFVKSRFHTITGSKTPFHPILGSNDKVLSFAATAVNVWDARGYHAASLSLGDTVDLGAKLQADSFATSPDGRHIYILSKESKGFKDDAGDDISARLVAKFSTIDGGLLIDTMVDKETSTLMVCGESLVAMKKTSKPKQTIFTRYDALTLDFRDEAILTDKDLFANTLHCVGSPTQEKVFFSYTNKTKGVIFGSVDLEKEEPDVKEKQLSEKVASSGVTAPVILSAGDMVAVAHDSTFHVMDTALLNTIKTVDWLTDQKVKTIHRLFTVNIPPSSIHSMTKSKEVLYAVAQTLQNPKRKDRSLLEVDAPTGEIKIVFNQHESGDGWSVSDAALQCISATSLGGLSVRVDTKSSFVHLLHGDGKYGQTLGSNGVPAVCMNECDKDGKALVPRKTQKPPYPGINGTTFPGGSVD